MGHQRLNEQQTAMVQHVDDMRHQLRSEHGKIMGDALYQMLQFLKEYDRELAYHQNDQQQSMIHWAGTVARYIVVMFTMGARSVACGMEELNSS